MTNLSDLEYAKRRLKDRGLSLLFVKRSKPIFETDTEGLKGFLEAIDQAKGQLSGATVADRVVGRAAALLCAYAESAAVFAVTMSKAGMEILESFNISHEYEALVPTILNRNKKDRCPFEKLVEGIVDPKKAYEEINRLCQHHSQGERAKQN